LESFPQAVEKVEAVVLVVEEVLVEEAVEKVLGEVLVEVVERR
jgi:hypothetical protein